MPCLFQNSDLIYVIVLVKNFLFGGLERLFRALAAIPEMQSSDPVHMLDGSQPLVTLAPGHLVLSCSLLGTLTYMVHAEADT